MTLPTRHPATGLRTSPIRYPNGRPPIPSGCRWCGIPQQEHSIRHSRSVGWHGWTAPTTAQTLARMRARRAATDAARRQAAWETTLTRTTGDVGPRERRRRRRANTGCSTCEHYLPALSPEEPCNPDGCGCTGYQAACDINAAPAAALPLLTCPAWQPDTDPARRYP
ncbi:hypothetical protein [Streptomyces sp. AD55]|uniref:hypothetical protein n=1 Tax=Streptomyces sp. AD55 TaxID=3242895 RepID=UPI00352785A6